MTVTTEAAESAAAATTEPRVFDSWINIPYLPGEVTPDPVGGASGSSAATAPTRAARR